jgi:hypothetical protein
MLGKVAIFIHQMRNLFLQPIILLHKQLIHSSQLPIHSLQTLSLFSPLLPIAFLRLLELLFLSKIGLNLHHKAFINNTPFSILRGFVNPINVKI